MMSFASHMAPFNGHTLPDGQDDVFVFPASFAQGRLWFLHQLASESTAYNTPAAVQITGQLNIAALRKRRHVVP